jgi:ferredoxin-NADP reductase
MIESIVLTVWVLPLVLIMPLSLTALGIVQVIGTFNNIKSHLGYEFFPNFFGKIPPFNFLVNATNHSLHHTQYNGNYGLFFRFWDILCGTELNTTDSTFNEIHKRNDERIIKNTEYRILTIDKLIKENSKSVSVYFKPMNRDFYNYFAGQYLTLRVKVDGKTYSRCFSLSSSPGIDDFLRITIKLKGEVSNYFYHIAKIGDHIESLLPVGDFIYKPNPAAENNYLMVAGGSGITPLLSMVSQILHFEPQSHIQLLYANKTEESSLFYDELNNYQETYPNFKYTNFISGKKRIGKNDLIAKLNTHFFICGPTSLTEGIKSHLNDLNVSKSNIHIEHFVDGYIPWLGLFRKKQIS